MSTLLYLPNRAAPTNLHLKESVNTRFVENDLYDVANRVKAISPRIYIIEAEENGKVRWIVMEHCDDGVDRLIFETPELDGRVVAKLQYLYSVPLHTRLDIVEKEEHSFEEARKEAELDELYERVGAPMWTDLEKCGFIDRPVSYPKTGVTGGRGSLRKS